MEETGLDVLVEEGWQARQHFVEEDTERPPVDGQAVPARRGRVWACQRQEAEIL